MPSVRPAGLDLAGGAIEQALREGNPTLRELRQTVADNIKRAQQASLLKGKQEPDFEISAPSLMDDQPLFGPAAALVRGADIRVFGLADGTEIGRDTGHSDDSYGLDFDCVGRLVKSYLEDYLRLYS